jgi:hypothetical protein
MQLTHGFSARLEPTIVASDFRYWQSPLSLPIPAWAFSGRPA